MTGVASLSRDAIAWHESVYVPAYLKNNARITIARVPGKTWLSTRFTSIYEIIYLCTDTDCRILVLYEYAVIRHRRKFILRKFYLPEISVYYYLWTQ